MYILICFKEFDAFSMIFTALAKAALIGETAGDGHGTAESALDHSNLVKQLTPSDRQSTGTV